MGLIIYDFIWLALDFLVPYFWGFILCTRYPWSKIISIWFCVIIVSLIYKWNLKFDCFNKFSVIHWWYLINCFYVNWMISHKSATRITFFKLRDLIITFYHLNMLNEFANFKMSYGQVETTRKNQIYWSSNEWITNGVKNNQLNWIYLEKQNLTNIYQVLTKEISI